MPTNKQRREAARRHLERQLERREESEARRKRVNLIISIVGTLVLIAVVVVVAVVLSGGNGKKTPVATKPTTPTSSAVTSPSTGATTSASAASYPCTWTKSGTAAKPVSVPATTTPPKKGTADVVLTTNRGTMTFLLDRTEAPCTVASFLSLTQQGFYNNTPCHRLVTSGIFVLQCGDPTGTGTGGPGYTIPDEYTANEKYTTGVLAMANTGQADTGGSQFFIVYKNTPLPSTYTIFGKVTSGLPIVDKVAAAGSDNSNGTGDGKPKLAITLKSVMQAT